MLEPFKQAALLILVATFLISGILSVVELQYRFGGRKARADVRASQRGGPLHSGFVPGA